MQFPIALAEAALASSAAGTHVTKAAFVSWALHEQGVTLCVGNKLVYWKGLHVHVDVGGNRVPMGTQMHTTNVSFWLVYGVFLSCLN
jgi:hypothetical protein